MSNHHALATLLVQATLAGYTTMGGEAAIEIFFYLLVLVAIVAIAFIVTHDSPANTWRPMQARLAVRDKTASPESESGDLHEAHTSEETDRASERRVAVKPLMLPRIPDEVQGQFIRSVMGSNRIMPDGTHIGREFEWRHGELVLILALKKKPWLVGKSLVQLTLVEPGLIRWIAEEAKSVSKRSKFIARNCLANRHLLEPYDHWKGD